MREGTHKGCGGSVRWRSDAKGGYYRCGKCLRIIVQESRLEPEGFAEHLADEHAAGLDGDE